MSQAMKPSPGPPPLPLHSICEIPANLETGLLAMSPGREAGRVRAGQEEMSSDQRNGLRLRHEGSSTQDIATIRLLLLMKKEKRDGAINISSSPGASSHGFGLTWAAELGKQGPPSVPGKGHHGPGSAPCARYALVRAPSPLRSAWHPLLSSTCHTPGSPSMTTHTAPYFFPSESLSKAVINLFRFFLHLLINLSY